MSGAADTRGADAGSPASARRPQIGFVLPVPLLRQIVPKFFAIKHLSLRCLGPNWVCFARRRSVAWARAPMSITGVSPVSVGPEPAPREGGGEPCDPRPRRLTAAQIGFVSRARAHPRLFVEPALDLIEGWASRPTSSVFLPLWGKLALFFHGHSPPISLLNLFRTDS